MKKIIFCVALATGSLCAHAQSKKELLTEVTRLKAELEELKKPKPVNVTTEFDKTSYGFGVLMATSLKSQGADSLDQHLFMAGLRDVLANKPLLVQRQEAMAVCQNYVTQVTEMKNTKRKEESQAFLEANGKKAGITTTASGLQYQVTTAGSGRKPGPTDRVTVHYTGRLIDGTMFDSSVERGQPATFGVNQVISGWTEALQLMTEGSKWVLYIPAELGYGERGAGADIPPHSALIFDVELIKVN